MAGVQSPATVIALLKKAKGTYQKAKPDTKAKAEVRHKEIVKNLQRLREMARKKGGPDSAKLVKPFNARKKILLKKLTEHRKKLNSATEKNADPNKAQLPGYNKALLKCTTAILRLDFNTVTDVEDAGANLDQLEEGDLAALDALDSMSDAELANLEQEDNAELPEPGSEQESPEGEMQAPEPGAKEDAKPAVDGIAVLKRFMALTGDFQAASARPGPHVAVLQGQHQKARAAIDAKDFAGANKAIDGLDALLAKLKSGPAVDGAGSALVGWRAARVEATQKLRQLEAVVAKTKHPLAGETVGIIETIVKKLAADPPSKAAATELAAYFAGDPEVAGLEGAVVENQSYSIRPLLLNALKALEAQLPS